MDNQNRTIITMLVIIVILVIALILRATVFNSDNIEISSINIENNIETNDENKLTELINENDDIYESDIEINNEVSINSFHENEKLIDEIYGANGEISMSLAVSNIIILAILLSVIISQWRIFTDSGIPGWQSLIPILNSVRLLGIVGLSPLWILSGLIPFVGGLIAMIINIILLYRLAALYNKSGWYVLGLMFLPFIFYPLMVFKK